MDLPFILTDLVPATAIAVVLASMSLSFYFSFKAYFVLTRRYPQWFAVKTRTRLRPSRSIKALGVPRPFETGFRKDSARALPSACP